MALDTLDKVLAGMRPPEYFLKNSAITEAAGVFHSLLLQPGMPGAAVAPTPGLNGAALTAYAGQIPFTNPAGGLETRLAGFQCRSTQIGTLALIDRLWHNSGIVVATLTAQAIVHPGIPARDKAGTVNGDGVMAALEVYTATTNAGVIANTTISYTNQAGTAGRTGTMTAFPITAVAGTFVPFNLQAGDTGIRSIQSITLGTSYGAGAIGLVQYRPLGMLQVMAANSGESEDAVTSGFVKLYNNTVPQLIWLPSAAATFTVSGHVFYSQG